MKKLIPLISFMLFSLITFSQNLVSINPNSANVSQTLDVTITGNATHFDQGSGTTISFGFEQGSGTTVINSINIISATSISANITIPVNTYTGDYNVYTNNVTDGILTLNNGFHINGITPPSLVSISPNNGNSGQTLDVTITGSNTHFNQGSGTTLSFGFEQGSGTTVVNSINIINDTSISANITIPANTSTGDYNVSINNSTDGEIYITNGFHVNGSMNLTAFVVPNSVSIDGVCDGTAEIIAFGGTIPFSYSFSNGSISSSADGLCAGLQSVTVTDALGETLVVDFIVPSPANFTSTDNFLDSVIVDSVYNNALINCVINYSSIDSVFISNFNILPNNFVNVTWDVFYGDSSVTITDVYGLDSILGVYMLALQLYCPNKSIGQFLTAYDQIYFDKYLSVIDKKENKFISIYPNPFKDQIIISLENDQASEVIISDISGKVIVNQKFNERVIHLDMNGLSAGQYVVTVKNETSVITRKIVK